MGKKITLTEDQIQEFQFYAGHGIPMDEIASLIGVSERYIWNKIKKNVDLRALYKIAVHKRNTQVASWLYDNCKPSSLKTVKKKKGKIVEETTTETKGNVAAQAFWLKTQAGWRNADAEDEIEQKTVEEQTFIIGGKTIKF